MQCHDLVELWTPNSCCSLKLWKFLFTHPVFCNFTAHAKNDSLQTLALQFLRDCGFVDVKVKQMVFRYSADELVCHCGHVVGHWHILKTKLDLS